MVDKEIKLTTEQIEEKKEMIIDMEMRKKLTEMQIEMQKEVIKMDMPMRQAKAQLKSLEKQVELDGSNINVLKKQVKNK